ncbi:hypothetical protein WMF38_51050 [Sorangium sp. So ce118]
MYDIDLEKPVVDANDDNRAWADALLSAFPELVEEPIDREAAALDLAGDVGMSVADYLARGIGITVERPGYALWVSISFWKRIVTIAVPNHPPGDVEAAIAELEPYIAFFVQRGFKALDPETGRPLDAAERTERLAAGYRRRHAALDRVAALVGGRVPGKPAP